MTTVDFHFDPLCPFAYQTSVWIRDVRAQLGITINWRFFSLEEINARGDNPLVVGADVVVGRRIIQRRVQNRRIDADVAQ